MNTAFVDRLRFIPCPKAHFDKQLRTRRVSIPFVEFQRGMKSRLVVNYHSTIHGDEKIGKEP